MRAEKRATNIVASERLAEGATPGSDAGACFQFSVGCFVRRCGAASAAQHVQ
jgi:hypothetical protein